MADAMTPCSVAGCPFCAASVVHTEASRDLGCPIWRCSCGGVGVGASPWDIDEGLDELEVTVGLPHCALGTTPTPTPPVGQSGFVHATYIDPPAMLAAAIASPPPGWRVGSSSATAELTSFGDPTSVHLRELIVVWATQIRAPSARDSEASGSTRSAPDRYLAPDGVEDAASLAMLSRHLP